jgi:hypothetical protein
MRRLALIVGALGLAWTAGADVVRDPTRPPLAPRRSDAPAREPAPVLSAVLNFNGERTAIFNGRLVRSGSVVGAYTIDSVLEDGVRYHRANQRLELHLAHTASTLKKPAIEAEPAPSGAH